MSQKRRPGPARARRHCGRVLGVFEQSSHLRGEIRGIVCQAAELGIVARQTLRPDRCRHDRDARSERLQQLHAHTGAA